jgi:hypothetical protein
VIIRLLRRLAITEAELVIRSPSVTAQRVLDVTGLIDRITVED